MRNRGPLISFTFDDFPRSALSIGGAILERHGARGTYYLSMGLMGRVADTGPIFEAADLSALIDRGHELGCHTSAHCHAYDTSPAAFERSVLENRTALQAILPGVDLKTLSYPKSCARPGTKERAARYFIASRGGGQTDNCGTIDLNQLHAFFIEQSRSRPEAIEQMIDESCGRNGWLILTTHDVCENPTRYGCTPELFERVVAYATGSGARICLISSALAEIGVIAPSPAFCA